MQNCTICPRNCKVDRHRGGGGYCGTDAGLNVASVCLHRGEEPVIGGNTGICNIFFAGCNLRCVFCQNNEISQPCAKEVIFENDQGIILSKIEKILTSGISSVGFVSPSHMIPQMKMIIAGIHEMGFRPVIIYNTNGYDRVETIKDLQEVVDVYLPDYKYVSPEIAFKLSGARNYPEIALKAIREMYYQKGSTLRTDNQGKAENGLLIRHLVLPGMADESKKVLESIADELSTGVSISLMSQYHPAHLAREIPPLDRPLYNSEYEEVADYMHELGFRNGWIQDMESNNNYLPDFSKDHPFEDEV